MQAKPHGHSWSDHQYGYQVTDEWVMDTVQIFGQRHDKDSRRGNDTVKNYSIPTTAQIII